MYHCSLRHEQLFSGTILGSGHLRNQAAARDVEWLWHFKLEVSTPIYFYISRCLSRDVLTRRGLPA